MNLVDSYRIDRSISFSFYLYLFHCCLFYSFEHVHEEAILAVESVKTALLDCSAIFHHKNILFVLQFVKCMGYIESCFASHESS